MQLTQNTIEGFFDAYLALVSTDSESWLDLLAEITQCYSNPRPSPA
jgi:hypothetical protein